MPLVPVKDLFLNAEKGGYAVEAFNCNNMEIVQAIVEAAEAEKSPVIMQASQGAREVVGSSPNEIDPRKILGPAKKAATELIREKIRLFGSLGKA